VYRVHLSYERNGNLANWNFNHMWIRSSLCLSAQESWSKMHWVWPDQVHISIYEFLDEFEIRFTCNLIFIFNFFLGRLWVCDLNTYHSHGKEGANKRHHQACGAEKEKPLSINNKADVGFFFTLKLLQKGWWIFHTLSFTNKRDVHQRTDNVFVTQYCANLGNLIDYEFTSY